MTGLLCGPQPLTDDATIRPVRVEDVPICARDLDLKVSRHDLARFRPAGNRRYQLSPPRRRFVGVDRLETMAFVPIHCGLLDGVNCWRIPKLF